MKLKLALLAAGLSVLAGCGRSHPHVTDTPTQTATVMPAMSGPSPTCRPPNYANVPGTREYNKKPCKKG